MESLDGTDWDVLIVGTGLQQSLLALALSRSGKKILHIDKNEYYGGSEAAFSLQEAEEWSKSVSDDPSPSTFTNAAVYRAESSTADVPQLSASRAYSLSLSPQLIYSRSPILPVLVLSKVYRQLEFLAVGTWWVYTPSNSEEEGSHSSSQGRTGITVGQGTLSRVPSGREDIFAAEELDMKAKRALMKFLRFIGDFEDQGDVWEERRQAPFSTILSEQFKVPVTLHAPLLALTLSSLGPDLTTTEFALPRVAIHLRSIGMFGPGFGAVIPRWGGLSEICQVACRAGAVGGAVYVLGNGLEGLASDEHKSTGASKRAEDSDYIEVALKGNETVKVRMVVGSSDDLEPLKPLRHESTERKLRSHELQSLCRSITVVSAPLVELFPPLAEGAPSPAVAVVFFPSGSLPGAGDGSTLPPVYVFVHSGDTGECPTNQSVLYATVALPGESGVRLLEQAVETLLSRLKMEPIPTILWSLRYEQHYPSMQPPQSSAPSHPWPLDKRILVLPSTSLDLVLDDSVLDKVKGVWQTIIGDEAGEFMKFDDREAAGADDEDDDA